MYSIYDKLNRIDDSKSLIESTKLSKKKKLTESVEDDKKKLLDAAASVKCKLDDDTIEYAMYDVDDFIENELIYCGKLLLSECPDMLFWRYVSDENFGSYCAVYESDEDVADGFYQISHDRIYDITDEVNGDYDYDDDIDEMLTESYEIDGEEVTWPEYFDYQMEVNEYFIDDNMFDKIAEKAYKLVEDHGYTDVFTETSTQAGRGGDFFWAKKNGISYRGVFDFETEQERFYDAAVSANSFEEAVDAIAKCYAKIILDSLKPVDEALVEGASEVYYLELFSNDGRTFEQSFSTYQEAEDEGKFSLENNPMTKEYIVYDKNHRRIKHER